MKKKTLRIVVIVLAIIMLLSVLVPALSVLAKAEVTKSDIDNLKNSLSDISSQKKEVQKQLNAIKGDLSKAEEMVALIESQIMLTEQEIIASQRLLDQYDLDIQQKEEDIAALEVQQAEQYAEFCEHVRWVEETGSVSYLSIIFQSSSFSQLLDYTTLISDIMDYSSRIIDALKATQAELDTARQELETDRAEQAEAQEALETKKAELETQQADAQALYDKISESAADLAAQARKLAAEESQIQSNLKKAEAQYAAQIAALNNSGDWYWPLPGIYGISSVYGGRTSPITGRWETHTGTDIPAAAGTQIHAAQGGVVTYVSSNKYSSYGWYCIISHGNGYSTLYAHQRSKPIVKVGETVKKGQVIGYVGTTGNSTGNHLHFELRINGARDNVLKLYPNLPYTGPYVNIIKKMLGK